MLNMVIALLSASLLGAIIKSWRPFPAEFAMKAISIVPWLKPQRRAKLEANDGGRAGQGKLW